MTGCRDRQELDISEVCKIIEWMADHTKIPILVDGDTGGIDANSARIMVNKLTKAGAAGVVIEDKVFPKHNSFKNNSYKDLADPEIHCSKIRAMKKENPEFVVIARLEEYIAGVGFEEAYARAVKYQEAGADGILVHSKIKDCSEIDEFMDHWNKDKSQGIKRVPIVIVPTKYYTIPASHFRKLGISTVIWANHNMRASIEAMQKVCNIINTDETLIGVEDKIATVSEIFRLQRDDDSFKKEFETSSSKGGQAVVLTAVKDKNFNVPKSLVKINDKTVLDQQVSSYSTAGVDKKDIFVVVGDQAQDFENTFNDGYCNEIYNSQWKHSTEVLSTLKGVSRVNKLPLFVSYGDLIFKNYILDRFGNDGDIVFAVDPKYNFSHYNDYIYGDKKYSLTSIDDYFLIQDASSRKTETTDESYFCGVFIGIFKVNTHRGLEALRTACSQVSSKDCMLRFSEVIRLLTESNNLVVKGVYVTSDWIDIDTEKDIIKAGEMK
jgi:phosphoenolpyruvate phosphomutase